MALRVLLADESTTIKKVMQLALQDFAVDVKAVHSGLDVAEVARSFQPDIVFADVLLAKRNGYDVAAELKGDANLGEIPVVLMWSSFMDIDENAFSRSKANSRLEKPFDVETLRSIVKELVPKTQSQRIAHFLKFPAEFAEPLTHEENQKQATAKSQQATPTVALHLATPPPATPPPLPQKSPPPLQDVSQFQHSPSSIRELSPPTYAPPPLETSIPTASSLKPTPPQASEKSAWNMDSFDPIPDHSSEFKPFAVDDEDEPIRITKLGHPQALGREETRSAASPSVDEGGDPWSHQNLSRFKLDIPDEDVDNDEISLVFDMNELDQPVGRDQGFLLQNTQPQMPAPGFSLEEESYTPIGEVPHGDVVISQFDGENVEHDADLTLEEDPNSHPVPVSAAIPSQFPVDGLAPRAHRDENFPQLSADQIERIIRAQTQETIEDLVRRIVPELATEIIRKELERLLREDDSASSGPKGKKP